MSAITYSKAGVKAPTQVKLDPELFGVQEVNQKLLRQAYDAYLANGRVNLAKSKTRGLISGGGRKPHPQKGTGRARSGSNRNPLWRGGGTIFGPTGDENYSQKINTKAKRVAVIHALSALNARGAVKVIDEISLKTAKTAELNKLLIKLEVTSGYSLIVTDSLSDQLKLASRNLNQVSVCAAKYLNVAKLLDTDALILTKPALNELANWLKPAKQIKDGAQA